MDNNLKGEGNSLNYTFRMYDPRVERFFAVDPLFREYPHNSVYVFSENRVIDSGELEGLERYYNAYGRFQEQKGESKIPLVRIGDNSYPLSRLDYNQRGTRIAVSKVIADQAMLRGYKGYYGVQNMFDEKGKSDNDTGAYTNKAKTIVVNGNQLQHGVYDNDHDLGSTLDHEEGHKNENIPQNKYTFVNHANVYLEQSKASDFSNTSKNNKYSAATGFVIRTYNAYLNKEISFDDLKSNVANFNKFNTKNGVQIKYEFDGMVLMFK